MISLLPWFVVLILVGVNIYQGTWLAIGALSLGYFVGLFVYSQMLLPLAYGLPRSTYLFAKGKIKFSAILSHFIPPVVWVIILVILGFCFQLFAPSLNQFLIYNSDFNIGGLLSIASLLLNFFNKQGRLDMEKEYQEGTYKVFALPN